MAALGLMFGGLLLGFFSGLWTYYKWAKGLGCIRCRNKQVFDFLRG